jgi:hypothetical protein
MDDQNVLTRGRRLAQQFDRMFTMQDVEQQHSVNVNTETRFQDIPLLADNPQTDCPLPGSGNHV